MASNITDEPTINQKLVSEMRYQLIRAADARNNLRIAENKYDECVMQATEAEIKAAREAYQAWLHRTI